MTLDKLYYIWKTCFVLVAHCFF